MVILLVPFGDESLPAYGLIPAALVIYLFDVCIIWVFLLDREADTSPK